MESTISVLIGSNFPMLRHSMVTLLDNSPNVEIVACAENQAEVLSLAEVHRPQVAILDLEMDWEKLRSLVSDLFKFNVPALLMNDTIDELVVCELLQCGANGIISRKIPPDLLCKSVRAVASGEIWVSRQVTNLLVQQVRGIPPLTQSELAQISPEPTSSSSADAAPEHPPLSQFQNRFNLTQRELDIVHAIGEAMSNKDIASHFGISEYTVKHHLTRIFDKVGVDSRLELMVFATYHHIIGTGETVAVMK